MSNIYKTLEKQSTYLVRINPYATKKNVAAPKAMPVIAQDEEKPADPVEEKQVVVEEPAQPEVAIEEVLTEEETPTKPKRRRKTKKAE